MTTTLNSLAGQLFSLTLLLLFVNILVKLMANFVLKHCQVLVVTLGMLIVFYEIHGRGFRVFQVI